MSTYQWLLGLHVTGAFLLLGGAVLAGVLNIAARAQRRPSEVALLLGLVRVAVIAIGLGAGLTLVLGLWLVHEAGYGFGQPWIWASLALWVVSQALGGIGGRRQEGARDLARRLAAEGDVPSDELRAAVREPLANLLSWSSGAALLVVLALMIFKPGAS